ncbi:hypothetical protein XF30_22040 [Bradyrhizobium sp. SUTN9-2]|nr:hypothetical protein XF30_22040 [Bradyrhizobium sp. SUTN9-2]
MDTCRPAKVTASAINCGLPSGKWWLIEPRGVAVWRTTSRMLVALTPRRLIRSAAPAIILSRVVAVIGNPAIGHLHLDYDT